MGAYTYSHTHWRLTVPVPGKLREGLSATKRSDEFAVEGKLQLCLAYRSECRRILRSHWSTVYETSLYLSLIFHSVGHITSVSSHLIHTLYARPAGKAVCWTAVLVQLQALADRGASQKRFYEARRDILKEHSLDDGLESWILGLARSLHRNESSRFETLSRTNAALELLPKRPPTPEVGPDLAVAALEELLDDLRGHARRSAWAVFRKSYREFGPSSRSWLARLLLFDVEYPAGSDAFDAWLARSKEQGEITPKEGVENYWMITKR